jgi:hypothetical protein
VFLLFFVISLIIFQGRSVIFAGAPIASICAGTSRGTIARLLPVPLPNAITGKQGGIRTDCYAIPYLRPLKSANTRRRVPVIGQYGIGPDKDMITDYCVGRNVDHALQASLITDNGITFNNYSLTNDHVVAYPGFFMDHNIVPALKMIPDHHITVNIVVVKLVSPM